MALPDASRKSGQEFRFRLSLKIHLIICKLIHKTLGFEEQFLPTVGRGKECKAMLSVLSFQGQFHALVQVFLAKQEGASCPNRVAMIEQSI